MSTKSVRDSVAHGISGKTSPAIWVLRNLTLLNIADDGSSRSHSGRSENLEIQLYDGQHIPFEDNNPVSRLRFSCDP